MKLQSLCLAIYSWSAFLSQALLFLSVVMLHGFISYFLQPNSHDFGQQSPAFSYICIELPKLCLNAVTHLLHSHTLTVGSHCVLGTSRAVPCSSVYGLQVQLRCQCCSPSYTGAFCLPGRSGARRAVSLCQPVDVSETSPRNVRFSHSLITVQISSLRFVNL